MVTSVARLVQPGNVCDSCGKVFHQGDRAVVVVPVPEGDPDTLCLTDWQAIILGCGAWWSTHAEPGVVATVGGLHALLPLVHHEVDVGASHRVRMGRLPVVHAPLPDRASVGRIGIDADDHPGPFGVAICP